MPIKIKDLDGGLGVLICGKDICTDEEYLVAHHKHLTQDKEKFKKYRYSLSDYTAVSEVDISNESIQHISNLCKSAALINPDPVIALVADHDLIYGLARMAQMLLDETSWEFEIFRKRNDAESWIRERVKAKYDIDGLTLA